MKFSLFVSLYDPSGTAKHFYNAGGGAGEDLILAMPRETGDLRHTVDRLLRVLEQLGALERVKLSPGINTRFMGAGGMAWKQIEKHPSMATPSCFGYAVQGPWPADDAEVWV